MSTINALFLVDVSWLMNKGYYAGAGRPRMLDGVMRSSGHIDYVISSVTWLKGLNPESTVILCLDGVPTHRMALLPQYKQQRSEKEFNIYADIPLMLDEISALALSEVYVASHPDYESDDIMATFVSMHTNPIETYSHIYLLTSDRDMWQLVGDRVSIIPKPIKAGAHIEGMITADMFGGYDPIVSKHFHDCMPNQLLLYRSMLGDSSDNIPSIVPRFPHKVAAGIAKLYETYSNLPDDTAQVINDLRETTKITQSVADKIVELFSNNDTWFRHYKVMRLHIVTPYDLRKLYTEKPVEDSPFELNIEWDGE